MAQQQSGELRGAASGGQAGASRPPPPPSLRLQETSAAMAARASTAARAMLLTGFQKGGCGPVACAAAFPRPAWASLLPGLLARVPALRL